MGNNKQLFRDKLIKLLNDTDMSYDDAIAEISLMKINVCLVPHCHYF